MEKYTVDLDQVLNDFEYSELTDQQSKNASERPQSTAFQPLPVTKHSINNVFHSLNEYLNSEISSSSSRIELRGQNYDQQSLGKNDNNLNDTITESYSKVNEPSSNAETGLDATRIQLPSFNNTFDSSGQNERLLKLKNEPQIVDILEKANEDFEYVNDSNAFKKDEVDQSQEGTKNLNLVTEKLQPNLLGFVEENHSSINNENLGNIHQDPLIENKPTERSNEDLYKTDNKSFSLLDMENVEPELTTGLNCTENDRKSKMEHVNNDKECDKNIDNKADNINNEQINLVEKNSFFDVEECKTGITDDNNVNIFKIGESKEILVETTENSEKNASYDNINCSKNEEHFVIEPSESPYALGQVSVPNGNESDEMPETPFGDNKVTESDENVLKLGSTIESILENSGEINKNSQENEQITKNMIPLSGELPTNEDSEIKEDALLIESPSHVAEDTAKIIEIQSENIEQKVVGFSTDLDIDENELNKMLEDLEIEEGSGLDDYRVGENDMKKIENTTENKEGKIKEVYDEHMGMNSSVSDNHVGQSQDDAGPIENGETVKETEHQPLHFEEKADAHKEIILEKPNDIVDSEKHSKKIKENIDTQVIECLEVEKPSKSKKNSSKIKETSEKISPTETLQEKPNNVKEDPETFETLQKQAVEQQENLQDEDKNPTMPLEKQLSRDSLTRPQDLPLKSESKEENVTRKIDLIGSPGSTPYNNVYINKSVEPKTTQDTDSDYTSSASPTFSDCSTDSTSTASTASVEDFPKNSDGASKNPGHKNRHSEKVAVKNRKSGQGGQGERNVQDNSNSNSEHTQDAEEAAGISDKNPSAEQDASDISEPAGGDSQERSSQHTETFLDKSWLGKEAPLWIPDSDAATCLHCDMKFTVLKRRHHCRACGLVLCSKCCNLKFRLEYLDAEARVCTKCYNILNKDSTNPSESGHNTSDSGDSPALRPNPNNPLEYCSTVSPLEQIGPAGAPPPSVMVPVGVLKRKGSNKKSNKSVMFCDGIAPGSDLTHLDQDFNYQDGKTQKLPLAVPEEVEKKEEPPPVVPTVKSSRNQPKVDQDTGCFIPKSETSLPPTVCVNKTDILYSECSNSPSVVEMLKNEALTFAINQNLSVEVKVINMSCCINKQAWCFSTDGLINVGSDEMVYLIEYIDEESFVPKDVFFHINNVYTDAVKGTSVKELGLSLHNTSNFLDSKNHAGFVYIRPSFQCLENVLTPREPYLIGILIHRWETPWAKLFPLRLVLRLGAEYRYYPSPLISTRHRDSVFVEIGHTIINLLADFRNFTYTLPQIRGLIIHMEDKKTTITIPRNRYDQVMKSINNSSDHILAFAGNFSADADSHLVCIQDTQGHENSYTTHAINIHNKPRKITGASFIVFNGSLKSSSGLTAKSNIVEDGLMIQIPSEHMDKIRDNLRNMKDHTIACGCINATSDETVNVVWGENDVDFNTGVQSPVDLTDMKGIPSIRVHNGKDHFCNNGTRLIRWTEVFILQNGEENPKNQDPVDISKVSESIAKACCTALVKYLDLLVSNSCQKIGIRVTLHVENVSYSAGSNGLKLPPIYMRSLDNELVPVLHRITSNNLGDNAIVLELIFRILNA